MGATNLWGATSMIDGETAAVILGVMSAAGGILVGYYQRYRAIRRSENLADAQTEVEIERLRLDLEKRKNHEH